MKLKKIWIHTIDPFYVPTDSFVTQSLPCTYGNDVDPISSKENCITPQFQYASKNIRTSIDRNKFFIFRLNSGNSEILFQNKSKSNLRLAIFVAEFNQLWKSFRLIPESDMTSRIVQLKSLRKLRNRFYVEFGTFWF